MLDLNVLSNYLVLVVVGICVCAGYVIKTSLDFIPNKYIPLIMFILGIVLNVWLSKWSITPEIVLGGAISGLAATGCHQAFKNMLEKSDQVNDQVK